MQRFTRRQKITIGRVPLGHHHGLVMIRWNQRVAGRKLAPGRYLITLRALNAHKRVIETTQPFMVAIS